MAIQGQLQDMGLPSLVQYACTANQTACLHVQHRDEEAEVYFDSGEIVHVALGPESGEEAFYQLLGWEEGVFTLEPEVPAPARTVATPWSMLLMDGLQRYDEETWDTSELQEDYDMPENIRDILVELGGQVPGFIATSVCGMDGLGIADFAASGINVEAINAQLTLLVKLVETTTHKLGVGAVEDHLLTTDQAYLLLRFLEDQQYYLGIAVDRNQTNLGNLRLNSRIYAGRIDKALPR